MPSTLALATHSQLSTLGADFSPQSQLNIVWRATAQAFSGPSRSAAPRLQVASQCAETFLRALKAAGLKSPRAARRVSLSCERLRLPRVFSKMGPSAKLKILRKAGTPLSTVNSFFRSASQLNTLRGFDCAIAPSPLRFASISAFAKSRAPVLPRYGKAQRFNGAHFSSRGTLTVPT